MYQSEISLGGIQTKSEHCTWAREHCAMSKYTEVVDSHSQTCEYVIFVCVATACEGLRPSTRSKHDFCAVEHKGFQFNVVRTVYHIVMCVN